MNITITDNNGVDHTFDVPDDAKVSTSAGVHCSDATDIWNEAITKFETPYETNACWWVLRELQKRGCITLRDEELRPMTFNL